MVAERFYLNICEAGRFPHCSLPDPPYRPYADAATLVAALAAWLAAPSRPSTAGPIIHYVGHGAITGWAAQPSLLQTADVAYMGAAPHLPVVLDMTCYTGYFHFPGLPSLAEAWLAAPQHGAVAVIASSGLDLVEAHAAFDSALLAQLAGKPATTIGQAFLAAKIAAAAGGLSQDVDTFHLFGDPAMRLWMAGPPTLQTPGATSVPALTPPVTPEVPPTPQTATPAPVPDPLPDFDFYLYLPWLPTELER